MIDLSTDYLGLKLKNPLVPSSSPLSKQLDTALRLEPLDHRGRGDQIGLLRPVTMPRVTSYEIRVMALRGRTGAFGQIVERKPAKPKPRPQRLREVTGAATNLEALPEMCGRAKCGQPRGHLIGDARLRCGCRVIARKAAAKAACNPRGGNGAHANHSCQLWPGRKGTWPPGIRCTALA